MAMNLKESYEVLGLPLNASEEEVKRAYKQKAREFHPDKNPDDPEATEKFQTLSQAYETIVSGSSQEPEEHEFFSGFFHYVILREMILRRRREQFMNRVFGGLFDDDTDEEYSGFPFDGPFGFFGMPFESYSQQHHNYQSRNQRRTQFEGQYNEDTTTEKTRKARKKQQRYQPFQKKDASPGQKMGRTDKEANCKCDTGQEKPSESSDVHGETMTSSRSTSKTKSPAKTKQKRKNNGQMKASEWQKGRKSKQAHKKKQQSYNRSSGPSVSKSQEHREQNTAEGATEEAKFHTQGTKDSDSQEECLETSANKTCQGTVQHKHKYFPESSVLKNSDKLVNVSEQIPDSGNQNSWGNIEGCGKDHKTTSKDILENGYNAMHDDATIAETADVPVDCGDGDLKRDEGFKQVEKGPEEKPDTNEHFKTSSRAEKIASFQWSCNKKDLNKNNNNLRSEKVENESESKRNKMEAKSGCNVTPHNATRISFVEEAEVGNVPNKIVNCDLKSKEEPVKINEHYTENKQEKNKVLKKENDLLWVTANDTAVPVADTLNSKEESNLSRTARIQSFQEPATKQNSKEGSVTGESELNDLLTQSVPTISHDAKSVPDVDHSMVDSNDETWKATPCGRNDHNQDTLKSTAIENVDRGRYKINSTVKDSKQSFDKNMSPEYGVKNTEHFPAAHTKRWTAKQDFRVNHKLKNYHFESQKGESAGSPETWTELKFDIQMKAGKTEKESGNPKNGDLHRENDVGIEKGTSRKPSAKETKRAPSVRQEHGQQSVSVGTAKENKGTSENRVSLDEVENRYHTNLAYTAREKSGENNETEQKRQFESNRGTKLDCDASDFIERSYDQGPGNRSTTNRNNLPKQKNTAKQEGKRSEGSSDHKWHFSSPDNENNKHIPYQAAFKQAKDFNQGQNAHDESSCDLERKPQAKSEVSTHCKQPATVDDNLTFESDSKDKTFESNRNEPTAYRKAALCDKTRRNPTKKEKRQQRRQKKVEEQDSTTIWNSVVSSNKKPWTSNVEANSNSHVKANVWLIMNSKMRTERYQNEERHVKTDHDNLIPTADYNTTRKPS